jgi:ribonuclease D
VAEYVYIDRQHQLDLAVSQLTGASVIGVDTESSGFYTYFSELCLIQLSGGGCHYLVDALTGLNLEGLGKIFANPAVVKIFHSAASDILELKRAHSFEFNNVFDTMLACRILGFEGCSLYHLVKRYKNVELEKKEQKSNWKRRPLTRAQLDYAHLDTLYLEDLMRELTVELRDAGVLAELQEEFQRVALLTEVVEERGYADDAWLRIPGALELSPRERGILKELALLRDRRARSENLAAFRVAPNEALVRMAREKPTNLNSLERYRALHAAMLRKDGPRIIEAIQTKEEILDSALPRAPEADPVVLAIMKRLKRWRNRIAEYRGMDSSMVLSNRALQRLAETRPRTLEELRALDLMTPWKLAHYGDDALLVLANKHDGRLPEGLPRMDRNSESISGAVSGARGG